MKHVDLWGHKTATAYDKNNADMFAPEELNPALDLLTELAGDGGVLEFAAGTGRLAIPLAERGLRVHAVDYSEPMLEQLRCKDSAGLVTITVADMARVTLDEKFGVVVVAYNSLANVMTQDAQVACFANAARHLRPGGFFAVELWVPTVNSQGQNRGAHLAQYRDDVHVVDVFDPITQVGDSRHYRHRGDGSVSYGHMPHRYVWPSELDLMAKLAGLVPYARYADWSRTPITADATSAVSIWQKPH